MAYETTTIFCIEREWHDIVKIISIDSKDSVSMAYLKLEDRCRHVKTENNSNIWSCYSLFSVDFMQSASKNLNSFLVYIVTVTLNYSKAICFLHV